MPPKKFVNIRIHGHTIQKLKEKGICMETILKGLGLNDVVVTDGSPLAVSQTLNTTIVSIGSVPRSSTPIPRQVDLRQKITFNLHGAFSEIARDAEEMEDLEEEEEKTVVEKEETRVEEESEMITHISEPSWSDPGYLGDNDEGKIEDHQLFSEKEKEAMDETETMNAPAISHQDSVAVRQRTAPGPRRTVSVEAPKDQEKTVAEKETTEDKGESNMVGNISEPSWPDMGSLLEDDDEESIDGYQSCEDEGMDETEMITAPTVFHQDSMVVRSGKVPKASKAPESRTSGSTETTKTNLKSDSSPRPFAVPHSHLNTTIVSIGHVPRSSTPIPRQVDLFPKITFNLHGAFSEIARDAEGMEDLEEEEEKTVVEEKEETKSKSTSFVRNISEPSWPSGMGSLGDNNDEGSIDNNASCGGGGGMDETETINNPTTRQQDSVAVRSKRARKAPGPQTEDSGTSSDSDYEDFRKTYREKSFNIKCRFPTCGLVLKWKPRYGKFRLISHALIHNRKPFLKCMECKDIDVRLTNLGKLRYHYKKEHKNASTSSFNANTMPTQDPFFRKILNQCFGEQIDLFDKKSRPKEVQDLIMTAESWRTKNLRSRSKVTNNTTSNR